LREAISRTEIVYDENTSSPRGGFGKLDKGISDNLANLKEKSDGKKEAEKS
jgi:hypothetical protein